MKFIYIRFIILLLIFSAPYAYSQQDITADRNTTPVSAQDVFERSQGGAPFNPSWVSNDVLVDTNEVYTLGIRPIAMKMGPDGYMYLAMNRRPPGGTPQGRINIYRSHNGGQNWALIGSISTTVAYFGQMSMLVENRSASTADSTRIVIFYTRSTTSNLFDANLFWASVRRDGGGFIGGVSVGAPSPGNKFFYPAAVSDGHYQDENTSLGVIVGEYNNTVETSTSFRFYRSSDWGGSFTSVALIDPLYPTVNEYFPTVDFKKGSTDSIYIAAERRSATDTSVRIIATSWVPSSAANRYIITPAGNNNYEKPVITILQNGDYANNERQMMITMIKNGGLAVYASSTNSGATWVNDNQLGLPTQNRTKFTYCSSDSNSAGGGNFVACYVNNISTSGDSLSVRRGILSNMGPTQYKVNQFSSSFITNPVCIVYNNGISNSATVAYAGSGPKNVYVDGEILPVGVSGIGTGIPEKFSLSQNYPNPFNPSTKINFHLPSSSQVRLIVFDVLGKEVASLVNQRYSAGSYAVDFNASNLAGGIYFYRLSTESFTDTKKMILIK